MGSADDVVSVLPTAHAPADRIGVDPAQIAFTRPARVVGYPWRHRMTMAVTGPTSLFDVTFFLNYAASQRSCDQHSLISLAGLIETATAAEKSGLPWFKLATFGDTKTPRGSLRHDANLLTVTGIEADYDAEQVSFDDAVQCLTDRGVLGIVYTSPSHTKDRQRWRVLCPLTTPVLPEMRAKMLGRLNGLYRGIFSVESWTQSQAYYYGSVRSNPSHKVAVVDGTPIDQHDELEELWLGKPNTAFAKLGPMRCKSGRINEAELLDQIVKGESYHAAAIRLLGLWALEGVPLTDAKIQLVTAMEAVFPPDRDLRWHERLADIDRCVLDVYGKEAGRKVAANDAIPPAKGGRTVGVQWGEPVDFLADNSMSAPTLGPEHVPQALWPYIADMAKRMGVDPSCVALAALVSCSSVISDDFEVQPKRHDYTWTEQARLWGAIMGEPSILKTPIISACTKPIVKLEFEARQRYREGQEIYQAASEAAKSGKSSEPLPSPPRLDRFMVENATSEALSEVLRDDEGSKFSTPLRKVLCRHDEMSEFFAGLDKYKAGGKGGSERGSYLRLYNGGPHTVDRIGRGSFAIPNWSATFLGGVQPGPIQRIARDAADDGLLQRFMFAVPDSQERGIDAPPDQDAVTRYDRLFPAMASMRPLRDLATGHPQNIVLAEGAHQHRERIEALAQAMTCMPDTSPRLTATLGKWPGLFARLCLTFHLIEVADVRCAQGAFAPIQVISPAIAGRVAGYMRDILLPHLLRAEAVMFSTDQTGHARWIAGFILANKLAEVKTRDIVRAYRAFKAPESQRELGLVMRMLVAVGWLDPEEPSNPVRPITTWMVNPAVHNLFARKAEEERVRRGVIKEQIANTITVLHAGRRSAG